MSDEPTKKAVIRKVPSAKKRKTSQKEKRELITNSNPEKKPLIEYKDAAKEAKAIMKQLGKVQVLDDQQIKSLLTLTALGLVKDRFGMEISADTRLKAISELSKINEAEKNREAKMSFENQTYEDLPSYLDLLKITPEEEAEANANASNTDSEV